MTDIMELADTYMAALTLCTPKGTENSTVLAALGCVTSVLIQRTAAPREVLESYVQTLYVVATDPAIQGTITNE